MPKNNVAAELRMLRSVLQQLQRSVDQLGPALSTRPAASIGQKPRRKLTLTPARRAALKLHGQYLGYMRGLRPREKSQVKKIRAAKGVRAAIAAARRLGA